MSSAEYKTVPAPRRVKKIKGIKGAEANLAKMVEEIISEQASSGWAYLRTDTFPMEERRGLFSSRETVMRGVMVFQRISRARDSHTEAAPMAHAHAAEPVAPAAPQPVQARRAPAPMPEPEDDFIARPVGGARPD